MHPPDTSSAIGGTYGRPKAAVMSAGRLPDTFQAGVNALRRIFNPLRRPYWIVRRARFVTCRAATTEAQRHGSIHRGLSGWSTAGR